MYSFSFFPLITKPTRITDTSASLIDHMWSTSVELNTSNCILHSDTTDHFPIISQFKLQFLSRNKSKFISKRCITEVALEGFKNERRNIG